METVGISNLSLVLSFLLLIIPVLIDRIYVLRLLKPLFISTLRMSLQLFLIGIFFKYLFNLNDPVWNILWFVVMITVAVFSAVKASSVKVEKVFAPVFFSFAIATFGMIFYLNVFVLGLDNVFDARYLVVLGGMVLGNSLRGNIVAIDHFYSGVKKDSGKYLYLIGLGATRQEAFMPYLRESVTLALKPTFAAMATVGVVSLPGMMTGVILGGSDPAVAIKYQIMIMIAIVVSTVLSVLFTVLSTSKVCFNRAGVLKKDVFRRGL